jgi:hypothetical protein
MQSNARLRLFGFRAKKTFLRESGFIESDRYITRAVLREFEI